jgi:hypothetical protein
MSTRPHTESSETENTEAITKIYTQRTGPKKVALTWFSKDTQKPDSPPTAPWGSRKAKSFGYRLRFLINICTAWE